MALDARSAGNHRGSQLNQAEQITSFKVEPDFVGMRLDAFLAVKIEGWSRSRLQSLITNEDVLVNEKPSKSSYKLRQGDTVEVELVEIATTAFEPENILLDIVFEDEFLAVINKPARMVVYPGAGNETGTLANAMAHHFALGPSALAPRLGIVHRLDKDTSGLIVVAKDEQTAEELSRQFHDREVDKSYVALVHGHIEQTSGKIDRAIARDRWHRTKMTVAANGRNALSLWKVRKRYDKFTLVEVDIKTGRTHQIRVHLASINHPVVGDATYNEGRDNTIADQDLKKAVERLDRFFLHAEKLSFTHPKTGERMDFRQPLPAELQDFLAKI